MGQGMCRSSLISLASMPKEMEMYVTSRQEEDYDLNRKRKKKMW